MKILNYRNKDIQEISIPVVLFALNLIFYYQKYEFEMMVILLLLLLNNILYSLKSFEKHFIFLIFNVSFFTFLLGSVAINFLSGKGLQLNYPENMVVHILFVLALSLFALFVGYFIFQKKYQGKTMEWETDNTIRKCTGYVKVIMYSCAIPYFYEIIEKVLFVQTHTYKEYYTDFNSALPYLFAKLSALYVLFFIIFAACKPNRKEFKTPAFLFILSGILALGYGQRNVLILNMLFVIVYCFLRNLEMPINKKWITKRMIILGCLCIPFLLAFLFVFQSIRYNIASNTNLVESLIGFFKSQGGSIEVIGQGMRFQEVLPASNYTFGPLITSLTNNEIIHQIFNTTILTPYTVEMATEGNIFAHSLTYLWNADLYLRGGGMGSSYVAEVYHDYSYIGVLIYNIILGVFLGWLSRPKKGIFKNIICLLLLKNVFYLPRDTATGFIANAFSITNILIIISLFILYKAIVKYSKNDSTTKTTLVLLTNKYPFSNSETFLEPEIPYLKKFDKIYCVPNIYPLKELDSRAIPYDLVTFKNKFEKFIKVKSFMLSLFESEIWFEIFILIKSKGFTMARGKQIISLAYHGELFYQLIYQEIGYKLNDNTVYYSYWLNSQSVAAVKLNRLYSGSHAISRAHGIDLYAYRNANNYQALRKYLITNLDKIYFISKQGMKYFNDTFGNNGKLEVAYLGTNHSKTYHSQKREHVFHIVSCSSLISLKRIHLIVEALAILKEDKVKWTHIGDGELFNDISKLCDEKLINIDYEFLGNLTHKEVIDYYSKSSIDAFINVSEFEGLPVSIMEVMSFGIPVIATDVGAVSEIVINGKNGLLLCKDFDIQELAFYIHQLVNLDDKSYEKYRKEAFKMWKTYFCAEKNYKGFTKNLIRMVTHE